VIKGEEKRKETRLEGGGVVVEKGKKKTGTPPFTWQGRRFKQNQKKREEERTIFVSFFLEKGP